MFCFMLVCLGLIWVDCLGFELGFAVCCCGFVLFGLVVGLGLVSFVLWFGWLVYYVCGLVFVVCLDWLMF